MKRVPALCVLVLTAACQQQVQTPPPEPTTSSAPTSAQAQQTIQYVAIDPSVFVPQATIDGWVAANPPNSAAMAEHAWALWTAMNAPSGQSINGAPLPVWETWYDSTEVYAAGAGSGPQPGTTDVALTRASRARKGSSHPKRRFHFPHQFSKEGHGRGLRAAAPAGSGPGVLVSFNRFTQEMKDHVAKNQYYSSNVLTELNNQWPSGTPLQNRIVQPFPNTSIMLKPVFWVVSGSQPTPVPYWNGTATTATSDPVNPSPNTWKQCVLADPTGTAKNDQPIQCNGSTLAAGSYQVVPVNADPSKSSFYAVAITQAEIDDLKEMNQNDVLGNSNVSGVDQLKPGDLALFVATHVSTREIDNWTWQTFFWQPNPASLPSEPPNALAAPPSIPGPWNQYAACTAYMMVVPANDPNGQPLRCYNPYLETDLTGLFDEPKTSKATGVSSNCMTCHRAAAWPGNTADYAQAFNLDPADPKWFTGNTKTDFAWSMVDFAHTAPFVPPPQ
jgi:hypothetical protein